MHPAPSGLLIGSGGVEYAVHVLASITASISPDLMFLHEIIRDAAHHLALRRVVLFGSRARGDERRDSDVDLAFEHDSDDVAWAEFVSRTQDSAPTLLNLDLVNLTYAAQAFRQRIAAEGKVIYER